MAETTAHRELKTAARVFLRERGYCAWGEEVACPIHRYRADVAAYADRAGPVRGRNKAQPHTAIIECKAFRSDFLRDDAELPRLLERRAALRAELERVEREVVRTIEPNLQSTGTFLFPEMEGWRYESSGCVSYRLLVRALRRLDRAIHEETKFFMLAHYRLADRLWVLTPPGLLQPHELPRGWGLLEAHASEAEPGVRVRERCPAPLHQAAEVRRVRLLRNIAVRGSREVEREEA